MSEKGFGVIFEYTTDAGTTWTPVGEVMNATPGGITKDTYETTHHQTPDGHKTFKGALVDHGEASIEIQYDPAGSAHGELRSRAATAHEDPQMYRFTYGDTGATVESFSAICTGFQPGVELAGMIMATVTFKVSGGITQS